MELDELKKIWSAYDQKLERNWQLNLHLLRRTNLERVKSKLRYLIILHVISLAFSILFGILLVYFVFNHLDALHFVLAGGILFIWNIMVAYSAVDQLRMVYEIDYADPILEIQKRLISLQLALIKYMRLSILIAPFYVAHILLWFELVFNIDMYEVADERWWIGQGVFTLIIFVPLTVWIYRKLNPDHINKAWMKKLIGGSGGKQLSEALDFLREIEKFERMETSA